MQMDPGQSGERDEAGKVKRRDFLWSTGAALASLGALTMPAVAAEPRPEPELKSMRLSSGRSMGYRLIGSGDKPLVLVHGFPGSSRQFLSFEEFLHKNGV